MKTSVILFVSIMALLGQWSSSRGAEVASDQQIRERLTALIDSEARPESVRARNRYRHPLETLTFFDIRPEQTVVEIWPGGPGGWYRSILEPFFADSPGRYIPVPDESAFPAPVPEVPDGVADRVLVFRAHAFMIYDHPAQEYFNAIFRMLKPGGIFGIVEHRGREAVPQDPHAVDGYVNQSHVLMLAHNAGFELVGESEINANPLDTKDYEDGVYSLPPTLRGSTFNLTLRARVQEIGESDRMTLKFRKP